MNTHSSTVSDAALEKATGKTWSQWLHVLEGLQARDLPHRDIAAALQRQHGVDGWWAQSITVGFERAIGRREAGQDSGGHYSTQASRLLLASKDQALERWTAFTGGRRDFDGVQLVTVPSVSHTAHWRYWRAQLADGSKITAHISDAPPGRARLAVQHEKLIDHAALERWHTYWKRVLETI